MQTVELKVQGMTCGGCVKHVTKALQSVPQASGCHGKSGNQGGCCCH